MTALPFEFQAAEQLSPTTPGERPIALQGEVLRRRIYSPQSYAPVRNVAVVPIVHSECVALASWFPLVWRRGENGIEFVAVRALLDDQRAQPQAARGLLPLILRAYPFVFNPNEPVGPNTARMLDNVFADAPTDVGASITTLQHRLSRGTTSRFRILDRYAQEASLTADIGDAVAALDEFEPWPLQFNIGQHRVDVPDLIVIRRSAFENGRFAPILEKFGMPCAAMLGLHRISLFRAAGLLAMSRAFFRDQDNAVREIDNARPGAGSGVDATDTALALP
jgi:SapC protein